MHLIDGKAFAARITERITVETAALKAKHDLTPGLAVVLVGEDPASQVYVSNKEKMAKSCGFASFLHRLPEDTSESTLLELIQVLNTDPSVHGILVQLPLPAHINAEAVINTIVPQKDVDGFTRENAGALMTGGKGLVACTPLGCLWLLEDYFNHDLTGKQALILGRSNIVGKPMAMLLLQANCTVTIAHSKTQNLQALCQQADIVVAAVGKPEMVKADWLNPNAVVIDVGINRVFEAGKSRLVGDVARDAYEKVQAITPVPGGVGPMTIACLLANTLTAAKNLLDA